MARRLAVASPLGENRQRYDSSTCLLFGPGIRRVGPGRPLWRERSGVPHTSPEHPLAQAMGSVNMEFYWYAPADLARGRVHGGADGAWALAGGRRRAADCACGGCAGGLRGGREK